MKQRIDPVNENETAWIKTQLENASKLWKAFRKRAQKNRSHWQPSTVRLPHG